LRLRASLVFVFGALGVAAVAACSGGGGGGSSYPPSIHASPVIAVASPLPSPVVNQSVAVAPVSNAAITKAPIPAPSGFTSTLSIPNATVPANTTITVNSSSAIPTNSSFPALSTSRRAGSSSRMPQSTGGDYTTIFFDSLMPSNPITVAGNLSATQAFPAGTLFAGTTYYLAFYDPTQASPAWQTIASTTPNADGVTLAFSGTAGSTTLLAKQTYGFAIFTVPAGSASTPPPAPALEAYIPQGSGGITVVNAAGVVATSLPINSGSLGLDDSGNVYALTYPQNPTPAPAGMVGSSPVPAVLAKYPAGSSVASITYALSQPQNAYFNVTSGSGELAAFGYPTQNSASPTYQYQAIDVWNAGSTGGAPSVTITEPSGGVPFGILDHAGNLYVTHYTATGAFNYDVYSPPFSSASVPSATIPETIVPPDQQYAFNPNYAAVGSDGTLYVTEYTFNQFGGQFDPLAGLYIYKPNASGTGYTESFVATTANANGPGPEGVDVDANNNIYVANSNEANLFDANGNYLGSQNDSLHDITIYGPGGTAPRHVTGSFSAVPVAVSADGTLFFSSFGDYNGDGGGVRGSFSLLPSATTVTQVAPSGASLFALYDGSRETTGLHRKTASVASGSSTHAGIGPIGRARISAARSAFLKRLGKVH
jgi:hypothetical protein